MRKPTLVLGIVLFSLALLSSVAGMNYFIRVLECLGYLPIPPSRLYPGYCGPFLFLAYIMSATFMIVMLVGLILIIWSVIVAEKKWVAENAHPIEGSVHEMNEEN